MNNGEDVIHLTRYEFDEYGSPIKQHNYTITITVAESSCFESKDARTTFVSMTA